ncbi:MULTISPECIES: isochorismatase family protein [Methanobacterium]|uniref:isochorismatase family protein n=1 Tax=Methanobacterium TaxID=2160 RepID=UPI00084BDF35|nr:MULTISPECIES: isochorismatase family protein [Methanobacterium]OEC86928.1 hypothetical protein A9507_08415 [Methanobacterium sp. A39]
MYRTNISQVNYQLPIPKTVLKILLVINFANENKIPVLSIQHINPWKDSATFKKGTDEHRIHNKVLKRGYDKIMEKNLPGSSRKSLIFEYPKNWKFFDGFQKQHFCSSEMKNFGCFTGPKLGLWLKKNNIDALVISGYITPMCCDTTAIQAMHFSFNVEFLSDATEHSIYQILQEKSVLKNCIKPY